MIGLITADFLCLSFFSALDIDSSKLAASKTDEKSDLPWLC
jgi:hypothetical protein